MEILLANAVGTFRHEKLHGRAYIVAPVTMIVPGVLHGSQGALYYPPEEIARNVDAWNGMPVVVYHPVINGKHRSARDPEVSNTYEVGRIYNTRVVNNRLVAEAWFDAELTKKVDPRVYKSLMAKEPIELSTGLFTDNHPAPMGSNFNGVGYDYVARNYRPDHLAILPDQKGACSLKDGCGVLVNTSCLWCREPSCTCNTNRSATMNKSEAIDFLVLNCSCWKGEKDKETLNGFDDEKIKNLVEQTRLAHDGVAVNELRKELNLSPEVTINSAVIKEKLTPPAPVVTPVPTQTVIVQPVPVTKEPPAVSTPTANAVQPLTLAEWEATMPPEALAVWNSAKEVEKAERTKMVANMTAHIADPTLKAAVQSQLNTKDIGELRLLSVMVAPAPTANNGFFAPNVQLPSFAGAGGAPVATPVTNEFADDVLAMPTMNWDDPVLNKLGNRQRA